MSGLQPILRDIRLDFCEKDSLQYYAIINDPDFWSIIHALNTADENLAFGWHEFLMTEKQRPFSSSLKNLARWLKLRANEDEYFNPAHTCIEALLNTPILCNISWKDFLAKLKFVNHKPLFDRLYSMEQEMLNKTV